MGQSRIPVRYAKALFALAAEKNMFDVFRNDMEIIYTACELKEFRNFLGSPVITTSKKVSIITEMFKSSVNEKTLAFLLLILKNKREVFLPDVARDFLDMYRSHMGIKAVTFTSSIEIDSTLKAKVIETVKKFVTAEIELKQVVDPNIIGGFILKIDDKQYDASIASKLRTMKRTLTSSGSK